MEWVWKKAMKPGNKAMNAGNRRTEGALERREPGKWEQRKSGNRVSL